jgi:hypothetical protein
MIRRKGGSARGSVEAKARGASEEMLLRSQWVASNAGSQQTAASPRSRFGLR